MSQGWISLHRQSKEHWLYDCKPFDNWHAWEDILLSVNHAPRKVLFDGQLIPVNAGQMITSLSKLTERWGWENRSKTRRFLELLRSDGRVELERNKNGTLLTVANWGKYQRRETQTEQPRNTDETQSDTNNNDNNENNNYNIYLSTAREEKKRADVDAMCKRLNELDEFIKRQTDPEIIKSFSNLREGLSNDIKAALYQDKR